MDVPTTTACLMDVTTVLIEGWISLLLLLNEWMTLISLLAGWISLPVLCLGRSRYPRTGPLSKNLAELDSDLPENVGQF